MHVVVSLSSLSLSPSLPCWKYMYPRWYKVTKQQAAEQRMVNFILSDYLHKALLLLGRTPRTWQEIESFTLLFAFVTHSSSILMLWVKDQSFFQDKKVM